MALTSAESLAGRRGAKSGRQLFIAGQLPHLVAGRTEIGPREVAGFLDEVGVFRVQRGQARALATDGPGRGGEKAHRGALDLLAIDDPWLTELLERAGGIGERLLGDASELQEPVFLALGSRLRLRDRRYSGEHIAETTAERARPGHRIRTLGGRFGRKGGGATAGQPQSERTQSEKPQRDSHGNGTAAMTTDEHVKTNDTLVVPVTEYLRADLSGW